MAISSSMVTRGQRGCRSRYPCALPFSHSTCSVGSRVVSFVTSGAAGASPPLPRACSVSRWAFSRWSTRLARGGTIGPAPLGGIRSPDIRHHLLGQFVKVRGSPLGSPRTPVPLVVVEDGQAIPAGLLEGRRPVDRGLKDRGSKAAKL